MDISALAATFLDTFVNFWLNLVLDGMFNLFSDLLFGGSSSGLV